MVSSVLVVVGYVAGRVVVVVFVDVGEAVTVVYADGHHRDVDLWNASGVYRSIRNAIVVTHVVVAMMAVVFLRMHIDYVRLSGYGDDVVTVIVSRCDRVTSYGLVANADVAVILTTLVLELWSDYVLNLNVPYVLQTIVVGFVANHCGPIVLHKIFVVLLANDCDPIVLHTLVVVLVANDHVPTIVLQAIDVVLMANDCASVLQV